jgi:presequence protease
MNSVVKSVAGCFEPVRSQRIDSLAITVHEYRHAGTGARHFHFEAADSNNSFMVALPTMPHDSTGVAHILEHTALCGSARYPVRDPFFMMLRRSLNTFMNAFTSSDATAYPFASQNAKDYDNLLSVYLDAVFFPRLAELDFAQEGHRIDLADPEDASSGLVYKGVVYNEMKGAMSSPVARLWQTLQTSIFPSTTYHYNSGGEPLDIPALTHAGLKAFHAEHYHPSNAVFVTYGDLPVAELQTRIHERALAQFSAIPRQINVPDEQRLTAPKQFEQPYAVDSAEDTSESTYVLVGWLLDRSFDLSSVLHMHLLNGLLLDNSASPLKQALETSTLGRAPAPICGLDDSTREAVFVCGLEGTERARAAEVETLILDTIRKVAESGVAEEQIDAVLHQMELAQRSVGGGDYPYGLQLSTRILPAVLHGGDPIAFLDLEPVLAELREQCRDPAFVPMLLQRYLLDNPHRVRVTLYPDAELRSREAATEAARLAGIAGTLSAEDRVAIRERAAALDARQRAEDDPEILPRVGLEDVPSDIRWVPGRISTAAGHTVHSYAQGTNGLVYEQIVCELPALNSGELELLPLLWSLMTEVGVGTADYLRLQQRQALTGRLSASVSVRAAFDNPQHMNGYFVLAGKGLVRNHPALGTLLADTLAAARFDEAQRLAEMVAQLRAETEAGVTDHGHRLAMLAAAAGLAPSAWLENLWDGPSSVARLALLDDSLSETAARDDLMARLASLHARLAAAPRHLLLVAEEARLPGLNTELGEIWRDRPAGADGARFTGHQEALPVRTVWTTNTEVNFCAQAYPVVPGNHADASALWVLGGLLHHGYLHRAIREQGGAYGSGARYDADSASFRFYSYRDPRLAETLADFSHALEWAMEPGAINSRALEEAILGVIRSIDQPSSPAGEALREHFLNLHGRTPERRRELRRGVLAVDHSDIQRVIERYFQPTSAHTAVVTDSARGEALVAEGYVRTAI